MDWQRAAVYYRFMFGDAIKAIAASWGLEVAAVEDGIRSYAKRGIVLEVPPTTTSASVPTTPTRAVRTPRRAPKVLDELHEATRGRKRRGKAAAAPRARRSGEGTAEGPDWQSRARTALQGRPAAATVGELVTVLRIPDAERQVATARLWTALQALVKRGEVIRQGTRYRVVAGETEAA